MSARLITVKLTVPEWNALHCCATGELEGLTPRDWETQPSAKTLERAVAKMEAARRGKKKVAAGTEAQEFLEWLAGWLDRIDPILRAVFAKADLTDDEHQQIDEWLQGTEVQSRLRALAARFGQAEVVT